MRKCVVLPVLALLFCACTPKLVILHTNDTHSHFEPLRSGADAGKGGCIEMAAYIDSVRAANGEDRVLLLHAGDFGQGTSYFSELGGTLEIEMLNALRFDCVTLGNHEFDNGIEDLAERLKSLECPCVCANLDLSSFELGQYVQPCAVIERGGFRIGIIGLESDISTNVLKTVSSRIPQLDNVAEVNRWADYLHRDRKCDMIILLSHLGWSGDMELVPQTRWIDIVVGGHSHTSISEPAVARDSRGRKVTVVSDGSWGLNMGELTVY